MDGYSVAVPFHCRLLLVIVAYRPMLLRHDVAAAAAAIGAGVTLFLVVVFLQLPLLVAFSIRIIVVVAGTFFILKTSIIQLQRRVT